MERRNSAKASELQCPHVRPKWMTPKLQYKFISTTQDVFDYESSKLQLNLELSLLLLSTPRQLVPGKMVKIAIAGGSGSRRFLLRDALIRELTNILSDVALEVIDALVATKNHEILLLSRKVRSFHLY